MSVPLTFDLTLCGAASLFSGAIALYLVPEVAGLVSYLIMLGGGIGIVSGILGFRGRNVWKVATVTFGMLVCAFAYCAWQFWTMSGQEACRLLGLAMAVMAFFCAGMTFNLLIERRNKPGIPRERND